MEKEEARVPDAPSGPRPNMARIIDGLCRGPTKKQWMHEPHGFNGPTRKGGDAGSPTEHRGGNDSEVVHHYLLPTTRVPEGNCVRSRSTVCEHPMETNMSTTRDPAETLYSV